MLSRLRRLHTNEEGVAIITAVLASSIIVLLGTTVVQLAVHNSEGSAADRRRVQSIAAAEAGLDYYMSWLTATGGQQPPCSVYRTMQGSPGSFTVTPTFYDATGAPINCPPPVDPAAVLLRSTGSSGTQATDSASFERTMEAYAKLTISTGGVFDNAGAIFAENGVNFTSNATIGGSNFSDADVFTNGNVALASNSTLYGRIFAQGSLTMASNAEVKKDVWTNGSITMSSGATIRGSATSSGSSMSLANNAHIYNGAKAAGAITGGTVDVYRSPNQTGLEAPPARTYPTFSFVPANWTAAGFTNQQTFSGPTACDLAESYIKNSWTSGSLLVRVTASGSTCIPEGASGLTFENGTYPVYGNLAIISDGPVTLRTGARFTPTAGTTANVFLMAGLSGTAPCNITMNTNSGFGPGLSTLVFTPSTCSADLVSNSALTEGQILSGTVNFHHTAQYSYKRLTVPGTGAGGFKQDLFYKREIIG